MKRAVIDIGTNTVHLIIGEVFNGSLTRVLKKKRFYTFLGEGGIQHIGVKARTRLYNALSTFSEMINREQCQHTCVVATDAIRNADNGPEISHHIEKEYGWKISTISGLEEADFIKEGVMQALGRLNQDLIIVDIGGGSVEFIGITNDETWYKGSFPIGISRLYERFHQSEPILELDLNRLDHYLQDTLSPLWQTIRDRHKNPLLVGCAGTFEVFLSESANINFANKSEYIETKKVHSLFEKVKTRDEGMRQLIPDLPKERSKYIVVALALMNHLVRHLKASQFIVSKYALKEGVMVHEKNFLD